MNLSPTSLLWKVLRRIRYSKIWKLILYFKPKSDPVDDSLDLIRMAQAAYQKRGCEKQSKVEADRSCMLISYVRSDGVGIQSMVRICVMFLAWQAKRTYVHLPFLKLAHQKIDILGCSLTAEEWAAKWEAFFNFGKDEFQIVDLVDVMGEEALARELSNRDKLFGDGQNGSQDSISSVVEKIRDHDNKISGIYSFNLGICREPEESQLYLEAEFIKVLQEKFAANGYEPQEVLYNEQFLNIAIHVRRGDVWDACLAGSKMEMHLNKIVSEEYYVGLLERLQLCFKSSLRPLRFHIFSDGRTDSFARFAFTSEGEASLKLDSGSVVENIQFHLRQSTIETLYHMINAPILIPGKSSFSVVAVVLRKSFVLYEDEIREFYQYALLEKYMEGNSMFIPLNELEKRAEEVMDVL